jgi:ribosome biogenesis protein YTM1
LRNQILFKKHKIPIGKESVIEIEFTELFSAPEPSNSIQLDDWISSVKEADDLVLIGCYNNTVQVCNVYGDQLKTFDGHTGAVKAVAWINISQCDFVMHNQCV